MTPTDTTMQPIDADTLTALLTTHSAAAGGGQPREHYDAAVLADRLRSISSSLADAAQLWADVAAKLAAIANREAAQLTETLRAAGDNADPMEHQERLQAISALTKMSNDASSLGRDMLAANKDALAQALAPKTDPAAQFTDAYLTRVA